MKYLRVFKTMFSSLPSFTVWINNAILKSDAISVFESERVASSKYYRLKVSDTEKYRNGGKYK